MDYYTREDMLRTVARRIGHMPTGEDLAAAKAAHAWKPWVDHADEKDVSTLVNYFKAHPPRVEADEAPGHWPQHSEEVMQRFKEEQQDALELFGLENPLELAQVAPFLVDRAVHEPAAGDPMTMTLPPVKGYAKDAILYFRGYFEDEWDRRNREALQTAEAEVRGRLLAETREWALELANPLYRFWLIAEDLMETTGIGETAAIAFLLADAPVMLPRLAYRVRMRMGSTNPGTTITLSISDLTVKPKEVARVYAYVRSQMLRDEIGFPLAPRGRQRIREQSDRTRQMVAFCRVRQGKMKFPKILERWNETHDKVWHYSSPSSLYNAYRVAQARWRLSRKKQS